MQLNSEGCSGKCSPGQYCPRGSTNATARPCAAGTFARSVGTALQSECTICPTGHYCTVAAMFPVPCPMGRFAEGEGMSTAECAGPCPEGTFCPPGTSSPNKCPAGRFAPSKGSSECLPCEPGRSVDAPGMNACVACARGKYSPLLGQATCFECPPGTFSRRQALECTSCPSGWAQTRYQSGVCIKCSEGKTTASNGSRVCIGKECKPGLEYLMMQDAKWDSADCPDGCVCARDSNEKDILVRAGYYRAEGITFLPCQVKEACQC